MTATKTIAVIPARFASSRFPGKPLVLLCGKPVIAHVLERARECTRVDEALVATDDERIADVVRQYGGEVVMTSPDCASGSDRIAEAIAGREDVDLVLNLQGDEPLISAGVLDATIEALADDASCSVATACIAIREEREYQSENVVKVVCDNQRRALYFSRSPLPNRSRVPKGEQEEGAILGFKHFGIYVYRREALMQFVRLEPGRLEQLEKLEQLRFLENGMEIKVIEVEQDSIGIDTPEDLAAAEAYLKNREEKGGD